MKKSKVKGLIGSSMGGFYACYFANKYNTKGVYINPVVDKHLDGMGDIVGKHKNFNNKNIDFQDYNFQLETKEFLDFSFFEQYDEKIIDNYTYNTSEHFTYPLKG